MSLLQRDRNTNLDSYFCSQIHLIKYEVLENVLITSNLVTHQCRELKDIYVRTQKTNTKEISVIKNESALPNNIVKPEQNFHYTRETGIMIGPSLNGIIWHWKSII